MLNSYFQAFGDEAQWDEAAIKWRAKDSLLPIAIEQWPLPTKP
jgi:hypothetical protein